MADGDVFDAHRLIRTGPDAWRSSYLGSATTLERAQALALANYKRLRASIGNFEQEVRAQRCDQGPVVVLTRRPQRGRPVRRACGRANRQHPACADFPTRIVIPSARCRTNAGHYPSDAAGDALDEQL
jgi:hypothetical protein